MKITVLVASYRRPVDLLRCLNGLALQSRLPDEVVVVLREDDRPSWEALQSPPIPVRIVAVREPGVLAANNAALAGIAGDLLSFIDDDASPEPDWLERIEQHFADPALGALGGRDRFAHPAMIEETEKTTREVGRLRWYGKLVNYHHRRFEGVAPADSLKGCNMTFRRELVQRCDDGLLGNACYYELDLCFRVKQSGYRVLFDGALLVNHYLGENHLDRFRRGEMHPERVFNDYHNRARVLFRHLRGPRWAAAAAYWLLLEPNLALARFVKNRYPSPVRCWAKATTGSWRGLRSLWK